MKYFWLVLVFASAARGEEERTKDDPFLAPGPKMKRAAHVPRLTTRFYARGFPVDDFVARDFGIVGKQVAKVVENFFAGHPPVDNRPIVIDRVGGQFGRTDATADPHYVHIYIALNEEDLSRRNYCRFVYQFSHELGHYYFDARRSNGLVETLCDALQYRVMREMDRYWKEQYPDFPRLVEYSDRFPEYWDRRAEKKMSVLSAEDRRPESLRLLTPGLDADFNGERAHGLRQVAARAFPEAAPWPEFVGIGARTDPPPSRDGRFREDLPTDLSGVDPGARKALEAIGR